MAKWDKARIGDLCQIVKGETGLASSTPGPYPLVATGADRRSCDSWQFDTDAVCIPLVSSTGHGKKTLNYVHYQTGKFAVGTILAAVIPKDPSILTARFLHLYLSHFKDTVLVPLMKGAANVSLSMKEIASIQIPVPSLDEQQSLIDLIFHIEDEHRDLLKETNRQGELLKQLRQAVLQDAVEGKLTTAWRKQNPVVKGDPQYDAAALLAKIKSAKEQLVKEGKIRKEKLLPPITDDEKPLALPEGWVWCRPAELGSFVGGGTPNTSNKEYWDGNIPWVTPKDMKIDEIYDSELKITKKGVSNSNAVLLPPNTPIFVVRSGILKRIVPISISRVECTINQDLKAWLLAMPELVDFVRINVKGNEHRILRDVVKKGMTVESFDFDKFKTYQLPFPPLAEQQAIIASVDCLMATIDELEEQVAERKEQAQLLMQAVLREAFNGSVERS